MVNKKRKTSEKEKPSMEVKEESRPEIKMVEKRSGIDQVIEYLNANIGKELMVRDIATALNMKEKDVRKHLRRIRSQYPDKVKFSRSDRGKLIYIITQPIVRAKLEEEIQEEESEEIEEAAEKPSEEISGEPTEPGVAKIIEELE